MKKFLLYILTSTTGLFHLSVQDDTSPSLFALLTKEDVSTINSLQQFDATVKILLESVCLSLLESAKIHEITSPFANTRSKYWPISVVKYEPRATQYLLSTV